ncbi:ubiquitin carboxyl-terminal hydrolase 36-like [Montipora foliosa]|uniref:ubiquitin carboxyl-terminal hydrolase 36-like n=1 Tax=Montipora foliosa TaxID=591990 RepID=UPI0035F1BBDD
MGMLPSINSDFQKGKQQCAAEFFQEICRALGYKTSEYQNSGFIPQHIDLSFLKMFFFNLRSEVLCLTCNNVSCNSTMETLRPLPLEKSLTLQQLIDDHSKPVQLETPYMCSNSETFTSISYTSLDILFTCNCQHQTEAWERFVFGKLPAIICLQLMRFSYTDKKLQHMVKYDDMMQLCEMQTPEKSQSIEISRVSYKLVAVVVHIGDKLFSGHCVCYMKRNGSWYFADDTHIKRCSTFEAINQKAYLVFYERDVSDDPLVEISQGISSFSIPSDTEQQPVILQSHETIQVQHGTPLSFM